ncbi:MAG: MlaA family lipoprotein [Gammaproteobacteria bacterium]
MCTVNGNNNRRILTMALFVAILPGCATQSTLSEDESDPLEGTNRAIYDFNESLDTYVMRPVAETYVDYTPELVRDGVTNFFNNLGYINVIFNELLQGKLKQSIADIGRFTINSTLGIGGFIDIASAGSVPKHDEDFGQTLGVWGVDEGAYLVLPVLGPSSARDVPRYITSTLLNPLFYITSPIIPASGVLGAVNERSNFLEATRLRDEAALDPYTFTREAYRQRRLNDIYDGNPPLEDLDEGEEGDEGDGEEAASNVLRIE